MAKVRKTVFVYFDRSCDCVEVFPTLHLAQKFAALVAEPVEEEWANDPKMESHWTWGKHVHVYRRVVMYE
jgi:hypothetical protein